ncbi:MAG TPA: YegS/Rv2252/BmrU family lipid kinase, partial [Candidatus Acidoferrales bacterium]|nr:YegS/Rv2252/BmrU family lipid kinase [Candidatus Acidoferrales bacterium]
VIPQALARNVPLGIVPVGTFNELARTLALPFDVAEACAVIAAGRTRTIDVASVNGRYYVNEASIGISSRIARLQTPEVKQRWGVLAVVATALQAFLHARPMHARVTFDDRTEYFKSVQLTVANSHRFGGLFTVGDAAIDDGWLDLYSVDIANPLEAFSVTRAMFLGRRESVPGLRTYRSTRFAVATRHRHRITADGEPAGKTPAVFEVLPKALRVLAP